MANYNGLQNIANEKTRDKLKNSNYKQANNKLYFPLRAMMAGFIIVLLYVFIFKIKISLPDQNGLKLGSIISSLLFGTALVYIIKMDLELATSNIIYSSYSLIDSQIKIKNYFILILKTLGWNFLGSVLAAVLFGITVSINHEMKEAILHTIEFKTISQTPIQIFASAIFANFCIGIGLVSALNMKNEMAQIYILAFSVFVFAFMGFEHVVANVALFTLSIFGLAQGNEVSIIGMILNIIFALFGNIVGGGILIGIYQAIIQQKEQ